MTHSTLAQVLRTAAEQLASRPKGAKVVSAIIEAAAQHTTGQVDADIYAHHAVGLLAGYWNTPAVPGDPGDPTGRLEAWASRCTTREILTMLGCAAGEADWLTGDSHPSTEPSPLAQAEQAKRERDLLGEIGALQAGYEALTSAPWYPAQAGDIVHVFYWGSLADAMPPQGETYVVEQDEQEGGLVLRALHADQHLVGPGCFAPGMVDDPLMEAWMEAGPAALTIVRAGRVIHPTAPRSFAMNETQRMDAE